MANLLHTKASKNKIINSFPTKRFGNDGDIVLSKISGRGVFLCSKVGGIWYVANKFQELKDAGNSSINKLVTKKLSVTGLINASKNTDKFIVSDVSSFKYRTGNDIVNDLSIPIKDIDYKTAYCSLGQYTDKDSCKANGGTWYYSENDSHDSISSTAENQLLTVGSSIGKFDAESTLIYDGSQLEIKYNSDFDDNWQTSARDDLLKLTYDSDNFGTIGLNGAGNMTFVVEEGNSFYFYERQTGGAQHPRMQINADDGILKLLNPANGLDSFAIDIDDNAVTTIATTDFSSTVGHLTLQPDGDLILDPATYTYSALPIGFTQDEPAFDATDTIVLFSTKGNKAKLTLTNNVADIHFRFPAVSGNFVCVILQDGTGGRTVSNWKSNDSGGTERTLLWAGGTAPSNTETADKADIASFYWDADNNIAYGTYTYNF